MQSINSLRTGLRHVKLHKCASGTHRHIFNLYKYDVTQMFAGIFPILLVGTKNINEAWCMKKQRVHL